jgi:hypothetical protein
MELRVSKQQASWTQFSKTGKKLEFQAFRRTPSGWLQKISLELGQVRPAP